MEQIYNEQEVLSSAQPATAELIEGAAEQTPSLKKFKTEEALIKAYNSLEAEFTKRCQQIKRLEEEKLKLLEESKTNETTVDNCQRAVKSFENEDSLSCGGNENNAFDKFFEKYPEAISYAKEISENIVDSNDSVNLSGIERAYVELLRNKLSENEKKFSDKEFLLSQIEGTAIKDEIIKNFLSGVKNSNKSTVLLSGDGEIALTPPIRPKTLQEATLLAKNIIKIR